MGENKEIKVRLGTVVCLFIIVLLIIGLVGMYLYYNKNNSNTIVGKDSEVKINEIGEKETYKGSDFEVIYNSLVDSEYSNVKSFITSDNKIKEIRVSGITIYTEDYLNATRIKLSEDMDENKVMGSCVFTVEFEDIKGLTLAGNKGNIHAIVGNCLTDEKEFVFDKKTNKIELCTSLYQEENEDEQNINENELKGKEAISMIAKEDTKFVINEIKNNGDTYIISASILEKEPRKVLKEEYKNILDGQEVTFRDRKWKYDKSSDCLRLTQNYNNMQTSKTLALRSSNDEGINYFENIAGVVARLCDYSDIKVEFEVSKDIRVCSFFGEFKYDNGKLVCKNIDDESMEITPQTIDTLIEFCNNNEPGTGGSYEECIAYVSNGNVDAIKIFEK